MKTLIALLAFASVASAETITLGPVGCGLNKQCINVPNDAAADVDIYGAPGYNHFSIYLDGVQYVTQSASGYAFDNQAFQAADGSMILASGAFTTYKTCTRSGRGQTCSTHWNFTGGSISR
jgi:hypothetical protein